MNTSPLMLTIKDNELLGVANRSDAMGVLAVWSVRGRDLVPHLTEQTTNVRGFQILVEAFRLWELYEPNHPKHAGRLDDFFLLIEQAFARTVAWHDKDWALPGARRVRARSHEVPQISLVDHSWHLLDSQKDNGLWGLYRGASQRSGLLNEKMTQLSSATMEKATFHAGIEVTAQNRLFELVTQAMDGKTVALPTNLGNKLTADLYNTYWNIPLVNHLKTQLIDGHDLNRFLAERLLDIEELDHRTFLSTVKDLHEHKATIEDTIRCENLLAVVEAIFLWLCASKGKTLKAAVADMPVNLKNIESARKAFSHSGHYRGETARARFERFQQEIDTTSRIALAQSVISLHDAVSEERGRSPWIWEDQGVMFSDVDIERPSQDAFQVGLAWRNDYYLKPLQSIAGQISEAIQ